MAWLISFSLSKHSILEQRGACCPSKVVLICWQSLEFESAWGCAPPHRQNEGVMPNQNFRLQRLHNHEWSMPNVKELEDVSSVPSLADSLSFWYGIWRSPSLKTWYWISRSPELGEIYFLCKLPDQCILL